MEWDLDPNLYASFLQARVRRGRGVGTKSDYIPWLKVRDVPSRGTSTELHGIRVPRTFHLLSKLETIYFLLREREALNVDIREQFPILDVARTLEICAQRKVRHNYKRSFPEPFTLDFLITEQTRQGIRYRAASIKTPDDAEKESVRARLSVEYLWCSERGIPWTLVTTEKFSKTTLDNLRFMRAWFTNCYIVPDETTLRRFARAFLDAYRRNVPLNELLHRMCRWSRQDISIVDDTFRYCVWRDPIPASLDHLMLLDRPFVMRRG